MNRNGATTRSDESEEIVCNVGLARRNNPTTKECFFFVGAFPHSGGKRELPAWGKKCILCGRMNHFARRYMSKVNVNKNAVKTVHLEEQLDRTDAESLRAIEEIGAVESNLNLGP